MPAKKKSSSAAAAKKRKAAAAAKKQRGIENWNRNLAAARANGGMVSVGSDMKPITRKSSSGGGGRGQPRDRRGRWK